MTAIDLLLVGDATDGPSEEFVPIDSVEDAFRLFGGYTYEQTTVLSGSVGYTLASLPWAGQVLPLQSDSDGYLIPKRLFEFAVSGMVLTWNRPGDQYAGSVIFRVTPRPGGTQLLRGILAAQRTGARMVGVRLGGTPATADLAGTRYFTSRYAGRRYNGTTVLVTGGVVTITPAPGTGRVRSYQTATDALLVDAIQADVARGWSPCYLMSAASNSSVTLPAGTYTLTGGTDGTMTPSGFAQFVADYDLAGVDVLCPLGLTTAQCSGAGVFGLLSENDYPTLLCAQAPASGVALSGIVNLHRFVASVAFQTTYDRGLVTSRVEDAAPLVGALISGTRFGITLAALPESPVVERFDAPALHAMASGGHIVAYRSIAKDWALWQAVGGDPAWPISTVRAYQELCRPIFTTLEPMLGESVLDLGSLNDTLAQALASVTGSTILGWELRQEGEWLYLDLIFRPYGEVRTIQATLSLGQTSAAVTG